MNGAVVNGSECPLPPDSMSIAREAAHLFKSMVECTSTAHFVIKNGRFIYANPAFEALTGYSVDQLNGKDALDFFADLPTETAGEILATIRGQRSTSCIEARILTRSGQPRWISLSIKPMEDPRGPTFLGTANDITSYKDREEALGRSERKYKTVFDLAPDMIFVHNTEGVIIDINPVAAQMLGYPKDEIIHRKGVMDTWTDEQKEQFQKIRQATFREGQWLGEVEGVTAAGELFAVESRAKVAELGGETIIIVISRDIAERRKMERQIRASLEEKETLLREIHHRVKNNMQIISTLLRLQHGNAKDESTRALFRESQNRIMSMALIHEKIYQSEGLHRIDIKDYMKDLAREALASFGNDSERIALRLDVENVSFGMDTAIPCGLIAIELLANSLKHAFPGGRGGEVFLNLRSRGQGTFELAVGDDGVGLPEGIKVHRLKSLGLRLVADLAKYQLDGDMALSSSGGGVSVLVRFREKRKPERRGDAQD